MRSASKKVRLRTGFEDALIRGFHGLYPEEKVRGNEFKVSIWVTKLIDLNPLIRSLDQTIDYQKLYKIAVEVFEEREDLLETLGQKILNRIKIAWTDLSEVQITIQKLNPVGMENVEHTFVELIDLEP